MNILFRCDGSIEIGMGHVVRCLALADELRDSYNCNITFVMRQSELGIQKVGDTYPVIIDKQDDIDFNYEIWLTNCILETKAEILIMDMRDGLSRNSLRKIKQFTGIKVVTIDDPEEKRLEADLAFYPPVPQVNKMNWDDFEGKLYSGWEYVLLRKEFSQTYPKPNNPVPNILVLMGGTDENNMTKFVIDALDEINEPFSVTIVLGPGYQHEENLKNRLDSVHFKYSTRRNPINIAELMSRSDFAIISFGQTAYELVALKVPSLYLCLSDDHLESSKLLLNSGIGVSLGVFSKEKNQEIIETVTFYITEKHAVKQMSKHAKLLNVSDLNKLSRIIIKEKIYG